MLIYFMICFYVSNKRQNGCTDLFQIFCSISQDPTGRFLKGQVWTVLPEKNVEKFLFWKIHQINQLIPWFWWFIVK